MLLPFAREVGISISKSRSWQEENKLKDYSNVCFMKGKWTETAKMKEWEVPRWQHCCLDLLLILCTVLGRVIAQSKSHLEAPSTFFP